MIKYNHSFTIILSHRPGGGGKLRPAGRIRPVTMLNPACEWLQKLQQQKFNILKAVTFVNILPSMSTYCPVAMSIVTTRPTKESNCPPLA